MVLPHLRGSRAILFLVLLTLLLSTTTLAIKVKDPVLRPSPTSSSTSTTIAPSSCPSGNDRSPHTQAVARPSLDTHLSNLYHLYRNLAHWRMITIRNSALQKSLHLYSHGYLPFEHHDTPNAHLSSDYDRVIDLDVAATMVAEIEAQIQGLKQEMTRMGCEEHVFRQAARGSSEVEVMEEWIRKNGRTIKVKRKGLEMRPRWGL